MHLHPATRLRFVSSPCGQLARFGHGTKTLSKNPVSKLPWPVGIGFCLLPYRPLRLWKRIGKRLGQCLSVPFCWSLGLGEWVGKWLRESLNVCISPYRALRLRKRIRERLRQGFYVPLCRALRLRESFCISLHNSLGRSTGRCISLHGRVRSAGHRHGAAEGG